MHPTSPHRAGEPRLQRPDSRDTDLKTVAHTAAPGSEDGSKHQLAGIISSSRSDS
ncbi:hypothetical protein [Streptomonospora litoralis]|uniref:Uncharacterized protein n=1 Tax=Streptomonospora litoralis TaxID=2498135 RepID=A0A4P6QAF9_9ACTN|nr:hypothetical protein [Streptomonospora litoralis]QBI56424.1 hypothetical protein EKD16_23375 [Streptomonospora litoralis]